MKQTKHIIIAALALTTLASCKDNNDKPTPSVPVSIEVVAQGTTTDPLSYSGTIEESTGSALSFGSAGTIANMSAREGMMVSAGQVLATLDGKTQHNMLLSAQAASRISSETLAQAQDAYERMGALHDEGSLPEIQWIDVVTKLNQAKATLEAAQAQVAIAEKGVADTHLIAPFSGYVSSKMADVGQQVAPGIPILRLVNIEQVKAKISVPEAEVTTLHIGQPMTITVATLPTSLFEGHISEIAISADPISRSYNVWITLPNSSHKLLPGMLCEVAKNISTAENITCAAQDILLDDTNQRYVWIVKNGKATRRHITTGANSGERVIITQGLTVGDSIITLGHQKVWEGMTL